MNILIARDRHPSGEETRPRAHPRITDARVAIPSRSREDDFTR